MRRIDHEIGFLETIFGLVLRPGTTIDALFAKREEPRHVIQLFLFLFLIFGFPMALHFRQYGFSVYKPEAVFSIGFTLSFTLLMFILCETLMLRALGVEINVIQVIASVVYAIVPFTVIILALYLVNFFIGSNPELLRLALFGKHPEESPIIKVAPFVFIVANFYLALIFVLSMRMVGHMQVLSALILSFLSLVPLYGAFYLSIVIAEFTSPGTATLLRSFLLSPDSVMSAPE